MPLRIATIGRNGQVARALGAEAAGDDTIVLVQASSAVADLRSSASLSAFIDSAQADVVINAGAYNLVDLAETEREAAFAINAEGPRTLARLCRERGVGFIHMSTDCVFDGASPQAYREDDPPNPLSAYGQSKLAGEQAVAAENPSATTTRVCWVFSEHGDNFVSKMIALARTRPRLSVVNDQIGPPTYAPDIARALIRIAQRLHAAPGALPPLLHLASPGAMDRASMARAILEESKRQGGPWAEVEGISSAAFAAPARRPPNARLSAERANRLLDLAWTPWDEAVERAVRGVLARGL
jgi:dTDP-4-dehydrorhamnose reductase